MIKIDMAMFIIYNFFTVTCTVPEEEVSDIFYDDRKILTLAPVIVTAEEGFRIGNQLQRQ